MKLFLKRLDILTTAYYLRNVSGTEVLFYCVFSKNIIALTMKYFL